ncbi:Nitroreductase [gamma proteobacterium HdN1]|nr:Nitroreductase [gamma proteobacterium HdN1]
MTEFSKAEQEVLQRILMARRDVRGNRFSRDPICEEDLQTILRAALWAPSVGYSQPWEFVIVTEAATRKQIAASFSEENARALPLFQGEKQQKYQQLKLEGILETPVNVAVFYKQSGKPVLGQTSMPEPGEYSVVCAVQNMWLMARALNIGMGWVSILDPEKVKYILNAPPAYKLVAYLCLGHVREFLEQPELELLQWERRKEMGEVVHRERFE